MRYEYETAKGYLKRAYCDCGGEFLPIENVPTSVYTDHACSVCRTTQILGFKYPRLLTVKEARESRRYDTQEEIDSIRSQEVFRSIRADNVRVVSTTPMTQPVESWNGTVEHVQASQPVRVVNGHQFTYYEEPVGNITEEQIDDAPVMPTPYVRVTGLSLSPEAQAIEANRYRQDMGVYGTNSRYRGYRGYVNAYTPPVTVRNEASLEFLRQEFANTYYHIPRASIDVALARIGETLIDE